MNRPGLNADIRVSYRLKRASDADYAYLYDLARLTMRPVIEPYWDWNEEWQANRFRSGFVSAQWSLILVDGRPAGAVAVDTSRGSLFVTHLYVHPDYQRRGIGTSILERLKSKAHSTGRQLGLNVLSVNKGAIRLYERLGFRTVEQNGERIRMALSNDI